MSEFNLQVGTDEIAVIRWDVPEKTLNILTLKGLEELEIIVENLLFDRKVKGVIITSGKKDFAAGMDLNVLANLQKSTVSRDTYKIFEFIMRVHRLLRKIELGGKDSKKNQPNQHEILTLTSTRPHLY